MAATTSCGVKRQRIVPWYWGVIRQRIVPLWILPVLLSRGGGCVRARGLEDQRRLAVRRVLEGVPVAVVAAEPARSGRWVREWVDRYDPSDPDWSLSESRAAHTVANRTSADVEQLVVEIRQRLAARAWAQVGASAIAWELAKLGIAAPPPLRTIARVLARRGLPRRERRGGGYLQRRPAAGDGSLPHGFAVGAPSPTRCCSWGTNRRAWSPELLIPPACPASRAGRGRFPPTTA
jgi:hypothetical protein